MQNYVFLAADSQVRNGLNAAGTVILLSVDAWTDLDFLLLSFELDLLHKKDCHVCIKR